MLAKSRVFMRQICKGQCWRLGSKVGDQNASILDIIENSEYDAMGAVRIQPSLCTLIGEHENGKSNSFIVLVQCLIL